MTTKVLIVVSSHSAWTNAGRSTGYWVGEVSHFAEIVQEAGVAFDIVSPQGGEPPMDPKSVRGPQALDGGYRAYRKNPTLQAKLTATLRPDQVDVDAYDAIYYAGGHGTMWDFPANETLAKIAARTYERGKFVAAVCHGVTGLLNVQLADGKYLIDGRPLTGFANIEERLMGLASKVPYLTETKLRERGARYERGLPFLPNVVVSDRLVTGQNPGSTRAVARRLVTLLAA
jgi:putative intracellular protease/amidase